MTLNIRGARPPLRSTPGWRAPCIEQSHVGAEGCGGCRRASLQAGVPWITCSVIVGEVIISFRDPGTEDVFDGRDTKKARKACPPELVGPARRKLDQLNQAATLEDLRAPPRNRLEKLKGDRAAQHSIRINDQYRVCFTWTDKGPDDVEIVDYH